MKYKDLKVAVRELKQNGIPVADSRLNKDGTYDVILSQELTDEQLKLAREIMARRSAYTEYLVGNNA